jgi:hypothetical protein
VPEAAATFAAAAVASAARCAMSSSATGRPSDWVVWEREGTAKRKGKWWRWSARVKATSVWEAAEQEERGCKKAGVCII